MEGMGESCCHCALPENQVVYPMATPSLSRPQFPDGIPSNIYVLRPPGDPCYSPLGLA